MDEVERIIKYIKSCREANIDVTITIDKTRSHLVLNVLQKNEPKKFVYPLDDTEEYKCPSCGEGLGFTDDYFGNLETTHFCINCGQRLCK